MKKLGSEFGLGAVLAIFLSVSGGLVQASSSSVWVFKQDGSISCQKGEVRALDVDAHELESHGLKVLESKKGNDGKMHMQLCGVKTGSVNLFLLERADLPGALKLGYQEKTARSGPRKSPSPPRE